MKIYTGYGQAIEVTDEWNEILLEADRLDYNSNQRETRRHCSLDAYNLDDALLPSDADVERDVISAEEAAELRTAIAKMKPKQRELIMRLFFEDVKPSEIARAEGVGKNAVSNRTSRALENLKKLLEKA